MKNKKIIIDDINVSECKCYNPNIKMDCLLYPLQSDACKDNPNCYFKQLKRKEQLLKSAENHIKDLDLMVHNGEERENELEQKLKAKEQELEELQQYHNKCCEENEKKLEEWLEKYNQVSRDFYDGKYCNKENCNLLKAKEQECEKAKQNAQDTYDLWQALIESFNILQGEKIKLEQECEELKKANDEKNVLLIKLGCPTTATARRKVYCLEQQLDQLKAENETLKQYKGSKQASYETMQNEWNKAVNANRQLKKENEELKENLSDLKKDLKFQNDKISELELDLQNANSTIENLDLMRVGEYNALVDDYNKLKQTLTEIKEIAEEQQSWNEWNSKHSETESEDDIFAYNWSALKQILQKINEVENAL